MITFQRNSLARVVPRRTDEAARVRAAVDGLLAVRRGCPLGSTDWKTLRDFGRRWRSNTDMR